MFLFAKKMVISKNRQGASNFRTVDRISQEIGQTMRSTVFCILCQKHSATVQQQRVCPYSQWTRSRDTRGCSNAAGHLYSAWLVPSIFREFVGFFFPLFLLWNGTAVHAATALSLSLFLSRSISTLWKYHHPFLSTTAPLPPSNVDPSSEVEALCCSSHPGSLFLRFFSPSDSRRPSLLSLPATSFSSAAAIPAPVASLTNRAAREYIFYRHSWWPPRICANLSA